MKTLILTVLLFTLCILHAEAQVVDKPLITVTGQAEVNVTPDEVVFNLEVETLNKNLALAKKENDERVRKVLALAKSYQVEAKDVQTDFIHIAPKYSSVEDEKKDAVFLGYEMSKKIVVILRDLGKMESFLSAVIESGVNRVNGVEFRSTQLRKHRDQARAMAIKAAQEKAIALTQEIGQKIGKAYTIMEEGFNSSFAANQNSVGYVSVRTNSSEEGSTIALGQIAVNAGVTVSFVLE